MKVTTAIAVGSGLLWASLLAAPATIQYRFSAAGNYPGALQTIPLADNLTQIVGYYLSASAEPAYVQTFGGGAVTPFITIAPPASIGGTSYASGINTHGDAVGGYCTPPGCNPTAALHGFIYNHGEFSIIDYPQSGATTAAYGINDLGQVVGGYCSGPYACPVGAFAMTTYGFLDVQGAFTAINYPGAQATQPNSINDSGVIVGTYTINNDGANSFIYQNGAFQILRFPGSESTHAASINNKGIIAGSYQDQQLNVHGFIYKSGKFFTVDHPNTSSTSLDGINDHGVIVGSWLHPQLETFKGIPVR